MNKGRWFRFYDDALDDIKVQSLSGEMYKTWSNLLCLASKNQGKIPPVNEVAFRLRMSIHDAQHRIEDLVLVGLLDVLPDKSIEPHNWSGRQYASDTSAARTRKYREKKNKKPCDVTRDGGVTPQNQKQNRKESLVPSSLLDAARGKEQSFDSDFGRGQKDGLTCRAEGLGLDVDDLIATVNERNPKKRAAYFTRLCLTQLMPLLPGVGENFIRDALYGKNPKGYDAIMKTLTFAE